MTSNVWIDQTMKEVPGFLGTCSIDKLITPLSLPSYTIINFSPLFVVGTHFVSILFLKKNICLYFDPLKLNYIPDKIINYMHEYCTHVFQIYHAIQSPFSGFCGFFCLIPIMLHVNELPIVDHIIKFREGVLTNDDICINLLAKLFKYYFTFRIIKMNQ